MIPQRIPMMIWMTLVIRAPIRTNYRLLSSLFTSKVPLNGAPSLLPTSSEHLFTTDVQAVACCTASSPFSVQPSLYVREPLLSLGNG
jgi:hypothetical protein